ncbi:uncharacterized protein LOC129613087 [Condylostylus longicornis]|uniref:uncharacterized protein LOC129613087 n=1 Tax=Condylostylus longicornis TaxID=2530218 RepID=UPI00244E23A7|nr:uncharacterized protein LOC129613087 [Condylostylus longicornis]XP_055382981.1 uncharacterized protein LOC129613087 [Condylostylus longicornis]XP_055382982.1 uncharacterized protein LOC129613087 [Condylostylus longicornis]
MNSNEICDTEVLPWLGKTYLEKILSAHENQPASVISFSKKIGTDKCENFASVINLINAEYTTENSKEIKKISLITKTKTSDELVAEIVENLNVFERETHVYVVLLKEFEEMLNSVGISTTFAPRYIYVDEGIIVMENLKEKGYALQDIKSGLNFQQCLTLINKLAQFHACSMVLYAKDPDLFRYHINPTITEEDENPMHIFYKNQFETCIEICKNNSELHKFLPNLEEINKNLIIRIANIFKKNKNGINVLNHGDAWANNFLYKMNTNGSVDEVLMVDYQEGIFGSPAIDLLCFIYSSWSKETYIKHKDDLIEYYIKKLTETLETLNYDGVIPTLNDIIEELKLKRDHGIVTATCLLPVYMTEHPDLADPTNFIMDSEEAKEIRIKLMSNEKFFDKLKLFLNGLLEN